MSEINKLLDELVEKYKYCLDKLLDIAEQHYPKYYSCDTIAQILDIYKELFG